MRLMLLNLIWREVFSMNRLIEELLAMVLITLLAPFYIVGLCILNRR